MINYYGLPIESQHLSCYPYKNWSRHKIRILEEDNEDFVCQINNINLNWSKKYFDKDQISIVYNEIFMPANNNSHAYEHEKCCIEKNDIVIDIGTSEGFFIYYSLRKNPKKILGIEPNILFFRSLQKNFKNNSKVLLFNKIVFSNEGNITLEYNDSMPLANKVVKCNFENLSMQITLSEIFDCASITKNESVFIKIDIENSEVPVIFSSLELFKKYKPKLSIAVYHDYNNAYLIYNVLKKIGYKLILRGVFNHDNCRPRPTMLYAW